MPFLRHRLCSSAYTRVYEQHNSLSHPGCPITVCIINTYLVFVCRTQLLSSGYPQMLMQHNTASQQAQNSCIAPYPAPRKVQRVPTPVMPKTIVAAPDSARVYLLVLVLSSTSSSVIRGPRDARERPLLTSATAAGTHVAGESSSPGTHSTWSGGSGARGESTTQHHRQQLRVTAVAQSNDPSR